MHDYYYYSLTYSIFQFPPSPIIITLIILYTRLSDNSKAMRYYN